jgi:hypothetical protein
LPVDCRHYARSWDASKEATPNYERATPHGDQLQSRNLGAECQESKSGWCGGGDAWLTRFRVVREKERCKKGSIKIGQRIQANHPWGASLGSTLPEPTVAGVSLGVAAIGLSSSLS